MPLIKSRSAVQARPRPDSMLKPVPPGRSIKGAFPRREHQGPMVGQDGHRPAVAYVLDGFPDPLQCAVLDEIDELGRCGIDVHVIVVDPDFLCIVNPWLGVRAPATATLRGEAWYQKVARDTSGLGVVHMQASWIAGHVVAHQIRHVHAQAGTADVARMVKQLTGISFSFIASAAETSEDAERLAWLQASVGDADFVVAPSEASRKQLLKASGPAAGNNIHRINWGVNLEKFPFHDESGRFPNSVLAVTPLAAGSGVGDLISAIKILRDRRPVPVRLTLVGDGEFETDVRARIALHRLDDRITLLPATTGPRLMALMCGHAVMALPYGVPPAVGGDGVPPVILQAMAVGLPVVSTFVRGVPEVLDDGRTGRLVTRDPVWLAGALETMLDDVKLRVTMARSAREKVERHFALSRNVPRLARLFATAASGRSLTH